MGKSSATPVWITVNADATIPYPVGTDAHITIGWQGTTPAGAGPNALTVIVDDGVNQAAYPVGVMAFGQNLSVTHHCTQAGFTYVRVSESVTRGQGTHLVDMGSYYGFAVG